MSRDFDSTYFVNRLRSEGVDQELIKQLADHLHAKQIEVETARQSRANLALIVEELKEQATILSAERDELIEGVRRLQTQLTFADKMPEVVHDVTASLSVNALTVFTTIGRKVDDHHTFSSLRHRCTLDDIALFDAVNELFQSGLLAIPQDSEDLEAFHLSSNGRRCMVEYLTRKHSA